MKLQKMLYYAQGYSFLWDNKPLFDEDFVAYKYGGVCREIYDVFSKYRQNKIAKEEAAECCILDDEKETIHAVWNGLKWMSGRELADSTCREDPWINAGIGNIITKDSIKEYFLKAYV